VQLLHSSLFVIINPVGGGHELARTVRARGYGLIPIFTLPRSQVAPEIIADLDVTGICFERDPQHILRVIEHERRQRGGVNGQIVAVVSGDSTGLGVATTLAKTPQLTEQLSSQLAGPASGRSPRSFSPAPSALLGQAGPAPRRPPPRSPRSESTTCEYIVDLCATATGEYIEWGVWHCVTSPMKGRRSLRSLPPARPLAQALLARATRAARAFGMTRGPVQCVVRTPLRPDPEIVQIGPVVPDRAVLELYRKVGRGDFCQQAIGAFAPGAGTTLPLPPPPGGHVFMAVEQILIQIGQGAAAVRALRGLHDIKRLPSLVNLTCAVDLGDVVRSTGDQQEPPIHATFAHSDENQLARDCEAFHFALRLDLDPLPPTLAALYHTGARSGMSR
jgi:hypothetical protein